jgi:5'(3')-deoxyribonucleotidase
MIGLRMNKNIIVDVDDVVASLTDTWIQIYNADHGDTLTKEDITDWSIGSFTKIGHKFYDYLENMNIYWGVKPVKDALKGIQFLNSINYKILYVTVYDPHNYKHKWLVEHEFLLRKEDFIVAPNKTFIDADIIIDDNYIGQIVPFYNLNKKAYLFSQPWNKKYDYKYRIDSWQDFIDKVTDKRIVL